MRLTALLALPVLALLLLAAHYFHAGQMALAAFAIMLVGLLAVRRPWAARTLQALLVAGAVEWVVTTVGLAQLRQRHDEPYLRLALILGAVTLLTALAALALQHPALRAYFRLPGPPPAGPAAR